jgi:hypothetical protein
MVNIRNCKIYGFQSNGVNGYGIYHNPSSTGGNLVVENMFIANNFVGVNQLISPSGTVQHGGA